MKTELNIVKFKTTSLIFSLQEKEFVRMRGSEFPVEFDFIKHIFCAGSGVSLFQGWICA